ncbi:AraC family transcriptional regulator [Aquimarina sp. TRL1]|uniref:AraC family transcriptional regulator n=1 Tax=Aquimarina sp. (strain TRL1) TaxID=2736252 RepID=UPI001589FEEA|nr:helix-turn-helix domain-containing protein [Aquimarina sp. TRL1]QKX06750.1 AraC family transcriptional regulator [Aquimarina sp. TRL1]
MAFSSLFLFFFGAIGIFNSFLISFYFLLFKKPKQISNVLFGWFLLFISERALRSLIYFFSEISPNAYSTFGPVTFLCIGPFFFLYIISVIRPESSIITYWKYHILCWVLVAISMHIIFPFRSDPIFYKKYILKAINIQWAIYVLIATISYIKHLRKDTEAAREKNRSIHWWLGSLLIAVYIQWIIYFFISYTYFVVGSIVFSVLFYMFYLFLLKRKKERNHIFEPNSKYNKKKIEDETASTLITTLTSIMTDQQLYKNSGLKSSDIAMQLGISTHQFSQLLNDNLDKSFAAFINAYRVEEAKRLIKENTKYTLEAIGKESGFNSKSTFYNSFKRVVGMTPSVYRDQFLRSEL